MLRRMHQEWDLIFRVTERYYESTCWDYIQSCNMWLGHGDGISREWVVTSQVFCFKPKIESMRTARESMSNIFFLRTTNITEPVTLIFLRNLFSYVANALDAAFQTKFLKLELNIRSIQRFVLKSRYGCTGLRKRTRVWPWLLGYLSLCNLQQSCFFK
jgi:hypothetical protein